MTIIKIQREILTDGSDVYDVYMGDLCFPCLDEKAANAFVSTVAAAIDTYTNAEVTID